MATIDEKFEKLIAEKKATEAVAEEASLPKTEVSDCLLYTSPSPRDATLSRMPSSA